MSIQDYVGRQVDLLAFDGMRPSGDTLLTQALALPGEGGKVVTGIQLLAQWVFIEFLTPLGSKRYEPQAGCSFMLAARSGAIRTQLEAEQVVTSALVEVRRNIRRRETADMPDDQRLQSLRLLAVSFAQDRIIVHLQAVSLAGSKRKVIVPAPVSVTSQHRVA